MENYESASPVVPEEQTISAAERQQQFGAKILSRINFQNKHEIVQKSFDKARAKGESLTGNNNERRNSAYLKRLDGIIAKGGDRAERQIWNHSKRRIHLVQADDISESTWRSIKQNNRDHGGGDVYLGARLKEKYAEQCRTVQKKELDSYVDYLASKDCPYPLWFKLYAWDGLTNLSRATKKDSNNIPILQKRSDATTSGFPVLNPAALAKTYDDITATMSLLTDAKETDCSANSTDDILEGLVKSGSFAKIYSYELNKLVKPVEVPDRTEDIHGEWVEYDLSNVRELSNAAEGTPWCVVSPNVAKNYLKYGTYGTDEENDEDEDEDEKPDEGESEESNASRFLFFHLEDPETGLPSRQACASIRLDLNGEVVEISGTLDGSKQRLHDSLAPIVEEKVKELPGGEHYYQAFKDNEHLISIDEKIRRNEPLTADDIYFVFEVNREIQSLNERFNDNRLFDFETHILIHLEELKAANADIDYTKVIGHAASDDVVAPILEAILNSGEKITNVESIAQGLNHADIWEFPLVGYVKRFVAAGVDINEIVSKLDSLRVVMNLKELIDAGANIDANKLITDIGPDIKADYLGVLRAAGAEIDVNKLVSELEAEGDYSHIARNLAELRAAGAEIDVNKLVSELEVRGEYEYINDYLAELRAAGAEIDADKLIAELEAKNYDNDIVDNLAELIAAGANIDANDYIDKDAYRFVSQLKPLIAAGIKIDTDKLISNLGDEGVASNLPYLIAAGISINVDELVSNLDASDIADNLKKLTEAGANIDVNELIPNLSSWDVASDLEELVKAGADVNKLLQILDSWDAYCLKERLIELGADRDLLNEKIAEYNDNPAA